MSITFSGKVTDIGEEAFAHNVTAEGDLSVYYSDDASSIIISKNNGKGKTLALPSELRGLPVSRIYWGVVTNPELKSVTIPDNVILGGSGTSYFHRLKTINIGSDVTIEGDQFDRAEGSKIEKDYVAQHPELFVPLHKMYNKNGRKAGTFTFVLSEEVCRIASPSTVLGVTAYIEGNSYWEFK